MTVDRELLELAAKAAGRYAPKQDCPKGWEGIKPETLGCFTMGGEGRTPDYQWNPLRDDGDALRLAVKLGIYVLHVNEARYVLACMRGGQRRSWSEPVGIGQDVYAATRRAIVRAAAEIQRTKEANL